jgi:hypothetical protein
MKSMSILLASIVSMTSPDFVVSKYSRRQLDGTYHHPTQDKLSGSRISTGILGQENGFGASDVCNAGQSIEANHKQ